MARDVEQEPRVGDVVRVIPGLVGEPEPGNIVVTAVTDDAVEWTRFGQRGTTRRAYWSGERIGPPSADRSRTRLELVSEAE